MKRVLPVFLSLFLIFSLTGCLFGGTGDAVPSGSAAENGGTTASASSAAQTAQAETEGSEKTGESAAQADDSTPHDPEASTENAGETGSQQPVGPGTAAPESRPAGPSEAEVTTAKQNEQIMTGTPPGRNTAAWQALSRINWADTVWADTGDLCHLRIIDVTDTSLTFYWHSRIDGYPTCFQSKPCTAVFTDDSIRCNYTDERGNSGLVRLVISEQAISFEQTIVTSASYSPTALNLTLLPKASGTAAFWFGGDRWQDNLGLRNQLYAASGGSAYQNIVNDYMENTLEITDVSGSMVYLLDTHTRFYTEKELAGFSKDLIRLFKNEIYARHGYRFETKDIYNIFLHFTWYYPDFSADNFKESVFNQYEKENLKLLVKLE